jgi:hypothetical protein
VRSTVEGSPRVTLAHDPENHTLQIAVQLGRRNTHRLETQLGEMPISAVVPLLLRR